MNANSNRTPVAVRYVLLFIGVALCAWSLSDDLLIGGGPGFGGAQGSVLVAGTIALVGAIWFRSFGVLMLIIYGSLFVAIAIGEITLRMAFAPKFDSAFQLSSQYLYELRPGVVKEFIHLPANGGASHLYRVNSDGFRGEELLDRNESRKRILVYGDSFIHAIFSENHATFSEQLETMLSKRLGTSVEVVNAGVAGYGPDQIVARMPQELRALAPDLIVVSIYAGNDFGDLARNKLYKLGSNGIPITNTPTIAPEIILQERLGERELRLRRLLRNIRDAIKRPQSFRDPVEVVNQAFDQQVREYEEFAVNGDNLVRELRSDPYSADISLVANEPSATYKIALMRRVLSDIQEQADKLTIPLVFMFIPHPIDVTFGKHESGTVDKLRWPEFDPNRLVNILEQHCLASSMRCLSLLEPFRAGGGASLYLKGGDDHWNDTGQQFAAKEMVNFLEQNSLQQ